jgi:hypothetical protein
MHNGEVEGTGLSVNTPIELRLSKSKKDGKSKGSDVFGDEEQREARQAIVRKSWRLQNSVENIPLTAPNEKSLVGIPNMVD